MHPAQAPTFLSRLSSSIKGVGTNTDAAQAGAGTSTRTVTASCRSSFTSYASTSTKLGHAGPDHVRGIKLVGVSAAGTNTAASSSSLQQVGVFPAWWYEVDVLDCTSRLSTGVRRGERNQPLEGLEYVSSTE
jgi:hypothetical protein